MRTGSVALREHRRRLGLTQEEVAERLGGALDANAVSRHERGVVLPSVRYRRLYARLYGVPVGALFPADDPVLRAPWDHAGTVEAAAALTAGGDVVERREFLLVGGVALTGLAHRWLIEEPGRVSAAVGGDRITPSLTARLPPMIAELRRLDDLHPPAVVRTLAERDVSWVVGMLRNSSYTEETGRELHLALAEFSQIAGYLSYDLGDQARAQRAYVTALRAAHTARDPEFGANVLRCMVEQAFSTGRPNEALTLSDTALAGLRGRNPSRLAAELWRWKAAARGRLGDRGETLRAIDKATDAFERATDPPPPWLYWLTAADLTQGNGHALSAAGLHDRATAMITAGLDALPADHHLGDRQLYLARLGDAQLHSGDVDAAVASGHRALDLISRRPSPRAAIMIRSVVHAANAHPTPATRDLADRTRHVLAA